jgi:hypothetical protein
VASRLANGVAPSASPNTSTSPTPALAAAARATSRNGGTVTSTEAPASASWPASSPAVSSGLAPVTTPPAAMAPYMATAYSGRLGLDRASTSPRPNPRAARPAATRSTAAAS